MEIQKIFSDLYDEERYYSVLMNEEELALYESLFSEDEEDKKTTINLKDVRDRTGIKRVILTAVPTAGGSIAGYVAGNYAANKADKEGKSDKEILRKAGHLGAGAGAVAGAIYAGRKALRGRGSLAKTAGALGLGTLGGYMAARVNTKGRLGKRASKERDANR